MKSNRFLQATALVSALCAFPTVGFAQTATSGDGRADTQTSAVVGTDTAAQTETEAAPQDIVVTGSRISSPNATSTSPITTITPTALLATSRVSIGDTLNTLPQLQSTFSQANSTRFLGTAGLNLLDLRGLGTQRTLVLVNGRRHVGSDILNNAVSVDINTIPSDLIESVDLTTGGDSAVYGSDAIAGIVNFKLKDNYQGLEARVQGGISQFGDAGSFFGSVLAGKNFSEGRGNIAINAEYARQNSVYASDRSALRQVDGFVGTDTDSAGIATGQTRPNFDGIPDNTFFRDIRSGTIASRATTCSSATAR
jgi:outer membrane receptor protein involved in Fe transport